MGRVRGRGGRVNSLRRGVRAEVAERWALECLLTREQGQEQVVTTQPGARHDAAPTKKRTSEDREGRLKNEGEGEGEREGGN